MFRTQTCLMTTLILTLMAAVVLSPTASAIQPPILVPDTVIHDQPDIIKPGVADTFTFSFANPPFDFTRNETNITQFALETKTDWGSVPRSDSRRYVNANYSIMGSNYTTGDQETHYIAFDATLDEGFSGGQLPCVWGDTIFVTIDGVKTYQLRTEYNAVNCFSVDYKTSFIVGMARNVTLNAWPPGTSPGFGGSVGGSLDDALTRYQANYTSAVFVMNPFSGGGIFNAVRAGAVANIKEGGFFAFNLTNLTALSVTFVLDGHAPVSNGFVYAFIQNGQGCDSVAQCYASGVACNGWISCLVTSLFGFDPSIGGIATFLGGFVSGFFTLPIKLLGGGGPTASALVKGIDDVVGTVISFYTFGLELILTSPVQLSIVIVGLGSAYSALIAALRGDPALAVAGTVATVKWFGIVVIAYFVVLFYLVRSLVWFVQALARLLIDGITAARNFFKLV